MPSKKKGCFDRFGGRKSIRGHRTGFFHLEKIDGIDWLVSPCGYGFLSKGVDVVNLWDTNTFSRTTYESTYVDRALEEFNGSTNDWTIATVKKLKRFGFNTAGDFSSLRYIDNTIAKKMPYVMEAGTSAAGFNFITAVPDFFSVGFQRKFVRDYISQSASGIVDDPYCIGVFLQSEGTFGTHVFNGYKLLLETYLSFSNSSPGKQVILGILRDFYGNDIHKLNVSWGTFFVNFNAVTVNPNATGKLYPTATTVGYLGTYSRKLGAARTYMIVQGHLQNQGYTPADVIVFLQQQTKTIPTYNTIMGTVYPDYSSAVNQPVTPLALELQQIEDRVIAAVAKQFYSFTTSVIRKYDQNHLILGIKTIVFNASSQPVASLRPDVMIGVDVISYDYYASNVSEITGTSGSFYPNNNNTLDNHLKMIRHLHEASGRPLMLAEFSFVSLDAGLPNTVPGYFPPVNTQEQRAEGYTRQVLDLMRQPFGIGYSWFGLVDQNQDGRINDGENNNFGLYNANGEPYSVLIERMIQVNQELERIHLGLTSSV